MLSQPDFHVVPRSDVAKYVRESHQKWLEEPGRKRQQHRDTDMRHFKDLQGKFKDRWDLLGLDQPALPDKRMQPVARQIGGAPRLSRAPCVFAQRPTTFFRTVYGWSTPCRDRAWQ
jgi:hypothetical protein